MPCASRAVRVNCYDGLAKLAHIAVRSRSAVLNTRTLSVRRTFCEIVCLMWCCPECDAAVELRSEAVVPWPPDWSCDFCGASVAYQDDIPCLAPSLINTMSGFDPRLFDLLVRYEQSSFWFVNRAKLITSLLRHYYPQAKNFLEIGCGTGSVLLAIRQAMPELQLTGSELHPLGLRYARERLGSDVTLLQMDARNIPCRDQFDVVGAFDVIEHIAEDERVLQAIHRSLKPRGGAECFRYPNIGGFGVPRMTTLSTNGAMLGRTGGET